MKARLRTVDDHGMVYDALMFVCPGCVLPYVIDGVEHRPTGLHMLPVNSSDKSPQWDWDRNLDAPTLTPSILTRQIIDGRDHVCHSFLTAGVFTFLGDCTHELAGQQVPMPDLPDWVTGEDDD